MRQLMHVHKPKILLQMSGLPLLDFADNARTHYLHQNIKSQFYSPAHSVCSEPHHLPFRDHSIDCIVCPHILELYPEDMQLRLLKEWVRVLMIGGKIVFFGINLMGVWTLKRLLYHKSLQWGPRISSMHSMQRLLIESGLTVDSVVYFSPNLSAVFHPQELIENQQSFWQFPGRLSPCYCMVASINDVEHIWTSDPCLNKPD